MKINIRQPLTFSEIGRKDNQEDTLLVSEKVFGGLHRRSRRIFDRRTPFRALRYFSRA